MRKLTKFSFMTFPELIGHFLFHLFVIVMVSMALSIVPFLVFPVFDCEPTYLQCLVVCWAIVFTRWDFS